MKPWRVVLALLLCLATCGCQTGRDRNRELLERELRWQEDDLFQLEDQLDDAQQKLDSCRRENEALRKQLAAGGEIQAPSGLSQPSVDLGTPVSPPATISPPAPVREFEPEEVEPALEAPPYDLPYHPSDVEQFDEQGLDQEPGLFGLVSHKPDEDFVETDYHIAEIELNKLLSGPYDKDGHPGSDGVLVVVEPRNAAGRIINVPAQISIAVVDPSIYGEAGRVARWDYSADEAADHFRQTPLGRGMQFRLPWPNQPPANRELQLHVRCITTDGIELRTRRDIRVALPGDPDPAWTAAAQRPAPIAGDRRSTQRTAVARLETVPIERPVEEQPAAPVRAASWDQASPRVAPPPAGDAEPRPLTSAWPDGAAPTDDAATSAESAPVADETADETSPPARAPRKRAEWSPYR